MIFQQAVKNDGTVVAWGWNGLGQTNVPDSLTDVQAISAGGNHTVALKTDGTIVAWGDDDYGQTSVPIGLTGVEAISAGYRHTVALKNDGTVVAWGQTTAPDGLTGVRAIAAGYYHNVALKSDGTVVAWGNSSYVPPGLTEVQDISAGGDYTVVLKRDRSIVAWGNNAFGQTNLPAGLISVRAIQAGYGHTVVLKTDGTVVAWGLNENGQTNVPVGLESVRAIAAGYSQTAALADSTLKFGNLFIGTTSPAKTFTIKNTGDAPLNVTNVSIIGDNASDFTVSTTGLLATVPVGSQTIFAVTFTPSALGARRTTLRVLNNDINEGIFDIILTGTGVLPSSPTIQSASLILLSDSGFQFTFANPSNATFSVLASTNLGLPAADWTVVGTATNIGGGLYQFAHPVSPDFPQRFYRLRFP